MTKHDTGVAAAAAGGSTDIPLPAVAISMGRDQTRIQVCNSASFSMRLPEYVGVFSKFQHVV